MALSSIGKDFVTKAGVIIEGTGTVSSSTNQPNALQVNGGAAIAANLIVGTTATIYGPTTLLGNLTANSPVTINSTLDVTGQTTLGAITATIFSATSISVTGNSTIAGILSVTNNSNATGYNNGSGALQVSGGAAVARDLWVGGTAFIQGDLYVDGTQFVVNNQTISTGDKILALSTSSTTSTLAVDSGILIGSTSSAAAYAYWLYDGTTGPGYWYTANGIKINSNAGSNSASSGALQVTGSIGVGGGIFVANVVTASNFVGYLGSANAAIGAGANLYGGNTGQLVYQSAPNTTGFLSTGTNGQLLYMQSGVPIWQSPSNLTAGSSTTATNIAGGLKDQIPYQSAPGQTTFNVGLVYNGTTFTTTNIQVLSGNNATAATGNSGAIMVTGGAGISQDLWVGGNINVNGSIFLKGVGLDTISGTTGTFVNINVTGTGIALTLPNGSVTVGQNLTATTAVITSGNYSTSTIAGNALQVTTGGIGTEYLFVDGIARMHADLYVDGIITGTSVTQLFANNGTFYGVPYGFGALYAGIIGFTPLPQTVFQATANSSTYVQNNFQNISTSPTATTDWVATAGDGNDSANYIDMGITTGNWDSTQPNSLGTALLPNDGYLYVQGGTTGLGNLVIGASGTSTSVKVLAGGAGSSYIAATFNQPSVPALSATTGTLVVTGGIGATSLYVNGIVTSTSHVVYGTTSASATNTGALQVVGGVGIGGGLYVGLGITATSITLTGLTATRVPFATTGGLLTDSANFYVDNSTALFYAGGGGAYIGGTGGNGTVSASIGLINSGAVLGLGAKLNVTGQSYLSGNLYVTGISTLTNTTSVSNTTTGALQVAGGVGVGGSLYVGGVVTATTFYGNLTGTASLATTSTNIAGGAAGSIPIQVSSGVTGFIPLGTSGYALIAGTNTATWTALSGLTAGSATTATNIAGFSAQQVLFQFNPGITTATSSLTYNVNNNQLSAGNLIVAGITTASGQLIANSGATSLGTNTGALVVYGGAGVTGAVSAGGIVYAGLQSAATNAPILTFSGGNTTFATYTSNSLTGSGTVTLDSWSTSTYRTARYVIQIVDSGKVHITEMTVFTDWTNVYMNQYGISTNQGELGTFDANSTSTVGSVTLTFSPSPAATAMTIKMSRLGITT